MPHWVHLFLLPLAMIPAKESKLRLPQIWHSLTSITKGQKEKLREVEEDEEGESGGSKLPE